MVTFCFCFPPVRQRPALHDRLRRRRRDARPPIAGRRAGHRPVLGAAPGRAVQRHRNRRRPICTRTTFSLANESKL